jgi:hypothetical protein
MIPLRVKVFVDKGDFAGDGGGCGFGRGFFLPTIEAE